MLSQSPSSPPLPPQFTRRYIYVFTIYLFGDREDRNRYRLMNSNPLSIPQLIHEVHHPISYTYTFSSTDKYISFSAIDIVWWPIRRDLWAAVLSTQVVISCKLTWRYFVLSPSFTLSRYFIPSPTSTSSFTEGNRSASRQLSLCLMIDQTWDYDVQSSLHISQS